MKKFIVEKNQDQTSEFQESMRKRYDQISTFQESILGNESLRAFVEQTNAIQESMMKRYDQINTFQESIMGNESLRALVEQTNAIQDSMRGNKALWELTDSAKSFHDSMVENEALMDMVRQSESIRENLDSLTKSIDFRRFSNISFKLPDIGISLADEFLRNPHVIKNESIIEQFHSNDLSESFTNFIEHANESTAEELTRDFNKLSKPLQIIFIWIIDKIVLTFVIGVAAGMYVDSGDLQNKLNDYSFFSQRDVTLAVKKSPSYINLSLYSGYRVVTGDGLRVRKESNIKSKILGKLSRGRVVYIIEKNKNWSHIEVEDENTIEPLTGWVVTRHLAILKR